MTAGERRLRCQAPHPRACGLIVISLGIALSQAAMAPEPSSSATHVAVIADLAGTVWIHPADGSEAVRATLGAGLQVGDTVETEMEALASIFVASGQILDLLGGSRLHIGEDLTADPPGGGQVARLSAGSLEVLENGMWALQSNRGKVIVGDMRGDGTRRGQQPEIALSPRRELVLQDRPLFFWASEESAVRVAMGQGGESMWRSEPVSASPLHYPDGEDALAPGVYQWWLESVAGHKLTRPVSFTVASPTQRAEVGAFESEMAKLSESAKGPHLAQVLRCAYYQAIEAWSRVLDVGAQLAHSDVGKDMAASAAVAARQKMRLGKDDGLRLAKMLYSRQAGG